MPRQFIHDIDEMKRSCQLELEQARRLGCVPAPAWFERVAILSRKKGNYAQEIEYCEAFFAAVEASYAENPPPPGTGIKMGPTYRRLVHRLEVARRLLSEQEGS